MPTAIFLPSHHDDEDFAVMIAEALAARPDKLRLYCNPEQQRLGYFERAPRLPGWMLLGVVDKAGAVHLTPEIAPCCA